MFVNFIRFVHEHLFLYIFAYYIETICTECEYLFSIGKYIFTFIYFHIHTSKVGKYLKYLEHGRRNFCCFIALSE